MIAPTLLLFILMLAMPVLLHRAALAGERRTRARRWDRLPVESEDEARRGYKTAQILLAPNGEEALLSGITLGGAYPAEGAASCHRPGCVPPNTSCECGFYAYKSRDDALQLMGQRLAVNGLRHKALLTVDLDGRVLQYEKGYRAERQQVMGIELDRRCATCHDEARHDRATCLAAHSRFATSSLRRIRPDLPAPPPGWLAVRPVCDRHIPQGAIVLGLPDLAGLLGTEVTWLV